MIKYFVRTTGERTLDESFQQIDYELLIDTKHQPIISFIDSLEYISQYDAILLEDDIILCKNFKNRIEEVISKHPNDVINFFTDPVGWFETRKVVGRFSFNQCTYYPKGISGKIADEMKKLNIKLGYDLLENKAMMNLNIPHIQFRPCLVQHIDCASLLPYSHFKPRRCIYFIDYLDELGITYEEARTKENTNRLREHMNEWFNNYIITHKNV